MKYEEIKRYMHRRLRFHYLVNEKRSKIGEYRDYDLSGQLRMHVFFRKDATFGETKVFDHCGELKRHYLIGSRVCHRVAVIENGKPATHSEEQLIEIAKEHNLPLLSELPKTEAEVTLWNLKYPDIPCLPIES